MSKLSIFLALLFTIILISNQREAVVDGQEEEDITLRGNAY